MVERRAESRRVPRVWGSVDVMKDFSMKPERWSEQWESWQAEQRVRIESRYPSLGKIDGFYVPHCDHLDGDPEPPQSTQRGGSNVTDV